MKSLVISLKRSHQALKDFKVAYRKAKSSRPKRPHYEIYFDNRQDFERFATNIHILSNIFAFKPKSIYELAKISGVDTSNLNKIILFFERVGVVKLKQHKISGRSVRTPTVEYGRIEFNLAA